jgi:hypothetical protein
MQFPNESAGVQEALNRFFDSGGTKRGRVEDYSVATLMQSSSVPIRAVPPHILGT